MNNRRTWTLYAVLVAGSFGLAALVGASWQTMLLIGFVFAMLLMHAGHGHGCGGHGDQSSHHRSKDDRLREPHDPHPPYTA